MNQNKRLSGLHSSVRKAFSLPALRFFLFTVCFSSIAFCGDGHALFEAVIVGDVERARTLLEADPNLVFSKEMGAMPLYWATFYDRTAIAQLLIAKNADVNFDSSNSVPTALHAAAMRGSTSVAELLLAHDAHVDLRNSLGSTP